MSVCESCPAGMSSYAQSTAQSHCQTFSNMTVPMCNRGEWLTSSDGQTLKCISDLSPNNSANTTTAMGVRAIDSDASNWIANISMLLWLSIDMNIVAIVSIVILCKWMRPKLRKLKFLESSNDVETLAKQAADPLVTSIENDS